MEAGTQSVYVLGEEDVEKTLEVEVIATNSSGRIATDSEPSPVIGGFAGSIGEDIVYLGEDREGIYAIDGEAAEKAEGSAGKEEEGKLLATCEGLGGGKGCEFVGPKISPDGESIAVEVRDGGESSFGQGTIYVMNFDGSEAHAIGTGSEPAWSTDGAQVSFVQGVEEETGEVSVVSVWADGSNGEEPEQLAEIPAEAGTGGVVWNESAIVYPVGTLQPEESELVVVPPRGGSSRFIHLPLAVNYSSIRLTPDGTRIVFAGETEPGHHLLREERIYEVNVNGTGLHAITPDFSQQFGVEYGPVSFAGEDMLVSRQFSVGIVASISTFGGGNGGEKFPVEILRLKREGSSSRALRVHGIEPDALALASKSKLLCPRGVERCIPWGNGARERAGEYARKWSKTTTPMFNLSYWHISNNCTNFVSQSWHAAKHVFMEKWDKTANLRWWTDIGRESRDEMNNANYNWANVNGFRGQQLLSKRARDMGRLLSPDWQEGDAVLLNWRASASDEELDHALIVTESSSRGRFVSSETAARNNVPWNEYFTKTVPEFFEKDSHESEYPDGWTWDVIRPTFKASNVN